MPRFGGIRQSGGGGFPFAPGGGSLALDGGVLIGNCLLQDAVVGDGNGSLIAKVENLGPLDSESRDCQSQRNTKDAGQLHQTPCLLAERLRMAE